jgi:hypothetical protein
MGRNLVLCLEHDYDVDCPSDNDCSWKLVSFGRRHGNYEDPDNYLTCNKDGQLAPANIGLRRKLQVGLAFVLSYYEHGGSEWSLMGEGMQCRWDTTRVAGILLFDGKPNDMGAKTLEDRAKDARGFLEVYNDWANGNTYYIALETPEEFADNGWHRDGEVIEDGSCGGFIGLDHAAEFLTEVLEPGDKVKAGGELKDMVQYLKLPEGVELVGQRNRPG